MTASQRLFGSQAALLVAVTLPLAVAGEGNEGWYYWVMILAASGLGWWFVVRRRQALLGPGTSKVLVVAAFIFLFVEYTLFYAIPVVALSHFMILVCVCRLLGNQSIRDQAQVFVLCLLLLVIAAIVSGNILFPLVLCVYLVIGLQALLRLHLAMEQSRVDRYNNRISHSPSQVSVMMSHISPWSTSGVVSLAGLSSALIGVAIFMLFPRIGAGMFGPVDLSDRGRTVTGFGSTLNFKRTSRILVSDQPAMTVKIEGGSGQSITLNVDDLYFRGAVFDQYYRRILGPLGHWEWRNATDTLDPFKEASKRLPESPGGVFYLMSEFQTDPQTPLLMQRYWLEPCDHNYLFTLHPALEIHPHNFHNVQKRIDNQVLQVGDKPRGILRYETLSTMRTSHHLVEAHARKQQPIEELAEPYGQQSPPTSTAPDRLLDMSDPPILLPDPPLPREAEIRALIDTIDAQEGTAGPLYDPEKREQFILAAQAYLRSPDFTYTLERTPVRGDQEPIGRFLLDHKRGHCEYFASALAMMCHYRGIPARVVTGYRGGDYNTLGDYYVVRQKDAHAWVEVFIPGRDWIRFDPTPGSREQDVGGRRWLLGIYKYYDYLQFQWVNLVIAYDSNARSDLMAGFENWLRRPTGQEETILGAIAAFIRELIWWRAKLGLYDRLLYWIFTIMVLALIILNGYVVVVLLAGAATRVARLWRRKTTLAHTGEAEFYQRFCRRTAKLGLQRRKDQTPAEFADELASQFPILSEAPNLVRAYYDLVFGGQELSAARRSGIETFLQRLRSTNREQLQVGI